MGLALMDGAKLSGPALTGAQLMPRPIILIPARMAAQRFPGKPLAEVAGKPLIQHVWRSACEADLGPVLVASPDKQILEAVRGFGGEAIKTDAQHPSGSDRIFEALMRHDPDGAYDIAINLQADLPRIAPQSLRAVTLPLLSEPLQETAADIATLCALQPLSGRDSPNRVKIAGTLLPTGFLRALYFSRAPIPHGDGLFYHHIGVYAFRRAALARFAALPPSPLERRERLEQLRALEAGMRIDAAIVDTCPSSVDTPQDLQHIRDLLE